MEAEMNSTTLETFWGKQLSSKNKTYEWNGEEEEEEGLDSTLEIRGACLGVNAKANERNVVTLTTEDESGEEVKHVILSMRLETNEQASLFLAVQPPVKLELVQGSGPVHIVGQMTTVLTDDVSSDEDEDDDESNEPSLAGNVTGKNVQKKRPGEFITQKPAKMAKLQNNNKDKEEEEEEEEKDDDDEESEQDVEEDTSMDVSTSPEKVVVKNVKKGTKKQVNEVEDDDDEEESDEDEEDSDEEDSDEESEDDDNEEEIKPKAIKFATPVTTGGKKNNNKFSTPQAGKPLKPSMKTPQSAQMKVTKGDKKNTPKNTPKNAPKNSPKNAPKNAPKGLPSTDDIKQKLLKSPNVPKKLEKFNNYMTSTYKITDNSVKKQMWEFVQKNRK